LAALVVAAIGLRVWFLFPLDPTPNRIKSADAHIANAASVLRGQHFLSTVPRLALLDPEPPLMEPYLLAYQMRLGKTNPSALLERVSRGEFDLVVVPVVPNEWRGIRHGGPELFAAIDAAYTPRCAIGPNLFLLPKNSAPDNALSHKLIEAGCASPLGNRFTAAAP
jgi:hypothetical protein